MLVIRLAERATQLVASHHIQLQTARLSGRGSGVGQISATMPGDASLATICSGREVPRLAVQRHQRRGALLGMELVAFIHRQADPLGGEPEQLLA